MMAIKTFWLEFIAFYHELPEPWKFKRDVYKNRNKKHVTYVKFTPK